VIGSANLSAELTQRLGVDLSYSNYSINQTVKTIRFADSLKVVESSSQFSLTPRYIISGASVTHSFIISANISKAKELNPARTDSLNGDINTNNFLLNYQLAFSDPSATVFASLNYTQMKSAGLTDGNSGLTLGASRSWDKGKLNLSASAGYLFSKRNDEKGRIITASLQGRYRFYKMHGLHLAAYFTGNSPDEPTAFYPKYTEYRAEIGYGFSF
jgi:hypothetical protein